jgi:hypothetical protein
MHLIFQPHGTPSAVLFAPKLVPNLKPMPYVRIVPFVLLSLAFMGPAVAGAQKSALAIEAQTSPQQLVREVVENGRRLKDNATYWAYRETVRKDGRLETHEVCQTSAGTIDRLVATNNERLSAEQQEREDARIQALLANPVEIRREKQKQREDTAKQYRMFSTFPDAFRYQYAGTEGRLIKLRFDPNPQFVPNTRQEEVFHHLEGTMWIDPEQKQLARIDGELTSEVKFAGGLLGRLDKGGVFSVRFRQVDSRPWLMAALQVNMIGKALLFKTISVQEEREFADYRRVPGNLTLPQAAELLEKMPTSPKQSAANTSK